MTHPTLPIGTVGKWLLTINLLAGFVYLSWWLLPGHVGQPLLYYLLLAGELYHLFMAYTFWYTVWPFSREQPRRTAGRKSRNKDGPTVDIYIPVAGEPVGLVRQTVTAALAMAYPRQTIYILNDALVAKKDNWREYESLARDLGVRCLTRRRPGGAKAGNINHALRHTTGDLIALFDADMVPHPDFLARTVPYFTDEAVAFVQTPQYYKNAALNAVTTAAWGQQEFFFGPVLAGKEAANAVFLCGTNVVMNRRALADVGGIYENSIAEDLLTSVFIHQKGWRSHYLTDVLVEGLAPEDLLSYYKQQYRWARGSLQLLFNENPLFKRGLSWPQKIHYLSTALYYLNGLITAIDMTIPLLFLFFNLQPVTTSTTSFALFFIPFIALNLYALYLASQNTIGFRTLSFTYASWFLQLTALRSLLLQEKVSFSVTPKQAQTGNYLFLTYPHLAYAALSLIGMVMGVSREGLSPAVVTNGAWILFNLIMFAPFVAAAMQKSPASFPRSVKVPQPV